MAKYNFLIIFAVLFVKNIFSQTANQKLKFETEKFKNCEAMRHGSFGYCILNAKTGKIIAEYNSQTSLVPASTLKTLTTAAALALLGKDFRYETLIQYTGKFDSISGIINGNIVIKGSGDPTLNSQYFKKKNDTLELTQIWAKILKGKGIKKITGKIIADNSCFENEIPSTWIWGDIGNYYGAAPNGLSYSDNKYSLSFKSGANNTKAEILSCNPQLSGVKFINKVYAGGNDDNAFIFGSIGAPEIVIKGTIPSNQNNYQVDGALENPALFCAMAFSDALTKYGIENNGKVQVISELNKFQNTTIFTHKSVTLDKIVFYTNMKSNNHYAESLLMTISQKKFGYGTLTKGLQLISDFWKNNGVDTEGLFMSDGSGLSRADAITPFIQATILSKIFLDTAIYKPFYSSLPVSGVSGGMITMGIASCAEGNMRAKSGYITRVRAYTGFVKSKIDHEYSFSIIVNNYLCSPKEIKTKIEALLVMFCELE